jgi:kynurenine formamidase
VVVDVTGLEPRAAIGWERIEPRAGAFLPIDLGIRTIGIDAINLDETPEGDLDLGRFRCHARMSAADGVIVGNLVGLGAIDFPDPFASVLALRIAGGDGAPARAVAIEGLG